MPRMRANSSKNWYSCSITLCAEISAASIVITYWNDTINVRDWLQFPPPRQRTDMMQAAVWISIIIVLIIGLNIFAVAIYGEAEFIFASLKILTIIGLLIMALCIDLGGSPSHDRLGFRFWNHPGAMKEYKATGGLGRFLGLFSVLINAAFSYGGVEMVAVAAGEAENPQSVNILSSLSSILTLLKQKHSQGCQKGILADPFLLRAWNLGNRRHCVLG